MGLTNDLVEVGVGVGIVVIAAKALGNLKIPAPTINPTPGQPGINYPPNGYQYGSSGSAPTTTSNQTVSIMTDAQLNPYIDSWFQSAKGWFGLGLFGYDPTNWTAFIQWVTAQYFATNGNGSTGLLPNNAPSPVFPSNATAYFNAKTVQWNGGITNPTITGQFS